MAKDYRQLWENAACADNEAQAIQILFDLLVNEEGRTFVSRLDSKDTEVCVEILDNVSRDFCSSHLPPPLTISLGCYRT